MNRTLSLAVLTALLGGSAAHAQDDPEAYARRLSELRTEVENLDETLELEREALRGELRTMELRKAELEARIRQEELRLKELQRTIERQREVLEADDMAEELLTPVLLEGLDRVEQTIRSGLPYRQEERLQSLDELRAKLQEGTLDPRRGVSRVWNFIEDELRLTRENVVDRQVIPLDGAEVLVRTGRIGMIAMFFLTDDGRVGQAARTGDGWTWTQTTAPEDVDRILQMFDDLEKQIRTGWFELPWALPEVSR